jgi:hypothetical protein
MKMENITIMPSMYLYASFKDLVRGPKHFLRDRLHCGDEIVGPTSVIPNLG